MHARLPDEVPELERQLHRWVHEGFVSEETAGRIWAFERGSPTAAGMPAARAGRPRRVPVLTEVIGYLGAALAAAAVAAFVGQVWEDLETWQRAAVPAAGVVVFLAAGSAIRRSREPAVVRLASLLGLVATASAGWLTSIVAAEVADLSDREVLLATGATVAICGGALFTYRRWPLLQPGLVAGLGMLLAAAFYDDALWIGVALTALGVAWAALGALRPVEPVGFTVAIGSLLVLIGPSVMADDWTGGGLLVGVGCAAGVVALGALLRQGPVIGIGVVGLFGYLVGTISHFLEGSAATAIGLLVTGVALMALAIVAMRARPRHGPPRPAHG
jgi:hypothetical protein